VALLPPALLFDTFGRVGNLALKGSSLNIYDSISYYVVLCVLRALILYMTIVLRSQVLPERLLVESTSLATIAACHLPNGDGDAEFLAVQWCTVCHEAP
jgi:hypothetical protein